MTFQTLISGNWDLNTGHLTLNTILFFVLYPLSVNNKEDLSPSYVAFFYCCCSCSVHTPVSITLACSSITEQYHNIFNGYLIFSMCEVQCLVQVFFFLSFLFTCWFLQSQSMTYKDLPSITQLPLLLPIPVFSRFNKLTFYSGFIEI